jgi:hypothetical protein
MCFSIYANVHHRTPWWPPGQGIFYNVPLSLEILNVKFNGLDIQDPFLFSLTEVFLIQKILETVVISLHYKSTTHQILPEFG